MYDLCHVIFAASFCGPWPKVICMIWYKSVVNCLNSSFQVNIYCLIALHSFCVECSCFWYWHSVFWQFTLYGYLIVVVHVVLLIIVLLIVYCIFCDCIAIVSIHSCNILTVGLWVSMIFSLSQECFLPEYTWLYLVSIAL